MIGTLAPAVAVSLPFHKTPSRRNLCRASVQMAPPPLSSCKPAASLYEVLRVNKNASAVEIKAAYRNLAKLFHPDSSRSSDGQDFIEIREAYSTLSDPASRAMYDLTQAVGSVRRAVRDTTDVGYYSSEFYRTRRWETDQCW